MIVLLHGWRAPGDDLVSLARELARPRRRFLVPAAPLLEPGGGRAWWRIGQGGHEIPRDVVAALSTFLSGGAG